MENKKKQMQKDVKEYKKLCKELDNQLKDILIKKQKLLITKMENEIALLADDINSLKNNSLNLESTNMDELFKTMLENKKEKHEFENKRLNQLEKYFKLYTNLNMSLEFPDQFGVNYINLLLLED